MKAHCELARWHYLDWEVRRPKLSRRGDAPELLSYKVVEPEFTLCRSHSVVLVPRLRCFLVYLTGPRKRVAVRHVFKSLSCTE